MPSNFTCLKVLFVCAAVTSLSSCGTKDENSVSFQSGGMTHTFAEGEAAKPDNFPLPIYPNAKTTGSVSAQGDADENSKFVMLSSTDSVDKIKQFYMSEMEKGGWKVSSNTMLPKLVNIAAEKDDLDASVMVSADEKNTTISLSVSKESKDPLKVSDKTYTPDKLNPPTD